MACAHPVIGIFHAGHKLVAHADIERLVGVHDGVERVCGVQLQLIVESQGGEVVLHVAFLLVAVVDACAKGDPAEIVGAVHPFGIELELGGGIGPSAEAFSHAAQNHAGVGEVERHSVFV